MSVVETRIRHQSSPKVLMGPAISVFLVLFMLLLVLDVYVGNTGTVQISA